MLPSATGLPTRVPQLLRLSKKALGQPVSAAQPYKHAWFAVQQQARFGTPDSVRKSLTTPAQAASIRINGEAAVAQCLPPEANDGQGRATALVSANHPVQDVVFQGISFYHAALHRPGFRTTSHVVGLPFCCRSQAVRTIRAFSNNAAGQQAETPKTKSVATPNADSVAASGKAEGRVAAMWRHIKHEAQHYWLGTKLLAREVGISFGIVKQILRGEDLTRREYRQLRNTSADLLKMIPFAVFILVPFMEALLPVALWLFPGMLPSTFQQEWKKEDEMKRKLKARIEVARFLQDAVDQMAVEIKKKSDEGGTAAEFTKFMEKVQMGDARVTNEQIVKFSKLFNDDITLDSVGRLQLVNLCRLLDIPTFGSDSFLKFQLLQRMRAIKADDEMIKAEGVAELTTAELREALAYRGMRAVGLSKERYQQDLQGWVDLSLGKNVPTTLLLMSRAFKITQSASAEDALKSTLQAMPKQARDSAESLAAEPDKVLETQRKLAELQREQDLIEEEKREKLALLAADLHAAAAQILRDRGPAMARDRLSAELLAAHAVPPAEPSEGAVLAVEGTEGGRWASGPLKALRDKYVAGEAQLLDALRDAIQPRFKVDLTESKHLELLRQELFAQRDTILNSLLALPPPDTHKEAAAAEASPAVISQAADPPAPKTAQPAKVDVEVVAMVAEVLTMLGSDDATGEEKELIETIKHHREEIKEELLDMCQSESAKKSAEAKAANRLVSKMDGIISRLEQEAAQVQGDIGRRLRIVDMDGDGVISTEEVRAAVQAVMKRKVSDEELAAVIAELDTDADGSIQLREVADIAHGLARARDSHIHQVEGGHELEKPEILNKALEELDDDETVLWGSLLEEYRDKVREHKAQLAQQKRVERDLAEKDRAAKHAATKLQEEEWRSQQSAEEDHQQKQQQKQQQQQQPGQ